MSTLALRRAKVGPASRWGLGRSRSSALGEHWDVAPATARGRRTREDNCVVETNALILDPKINGSAIVISHMESLVHRYVEEAKQEGLSVLVERHARLVQREEHFAEARQNLALQTGEGVVDALLEHAETLVEIVAIRRALGMED